MNKTKRGDQTLPTSILLKIRAMVIEMFIVFVKGFGKTERVE